MTDAVSYQQMGTAVRGQALVTGGQRILASALARTVKAIEAQNSLPGQARS